MKIKGDYYLLTLSNRREQVYLTQIEAEAVMLLLNSRQKPQFIKIADGMINTSYIISLEKEDDSVYPSQAEEIEGREEKIHQKFLDTFEKKYLELPAPK